METLSETKITPFLQTALNIGRKICRDAIWHKNSCNWQGPSLESVEGKMEVVHRTFGPGIYSGLAGIALFLAELKNAIPDDEIVGETLRGTMNNLTLQSDDLDPENTFGLYSGKVGIGYTFWKIGLLAQNDEWTKTGLQILRGLTQLQPSELEIDVVSGAAGAIPVLLRVYKHSHDETLLALSIKCGDFLLHKASKGEASWSWETIPGNIGLTGFSHGAAGIALALLELYVVTKKAEYLEGAEKGFNYERACFIPQQANWPDLRQNISKVIGQQSQVTCSLMWCHGAPGIALSRLRAFQLTGRNDFLQEALIALHTTYKSVLNQIQSPENLNYSLCHGLAGNADILLEASYILNNAVYANIAKVVGQAGITFFDISGLDWPSGLNNPIPNAPQRETTPGLMLGLSGTGHFYLRLAAPSTIESTLIIQP